jgi:hypothetical protein
MYLRELGTNQAGLMFGYDIWCQYSANLYSRFEKDTLLRDVAHLVKDAQGVIGPLHILGHTARCQTLYSAGTTPHAGRTCGDNVESPFSETKILGPVIKHKNDGNRQDTIITVITEFNFRSQLRLRTLHSWYSMDSPHHYTQLGISQSATLILPKRSTNWPLPSRT